MDEPLDHTQATTLDPDPPELVRLSLEGPRPQRRATVAFRIILAIPHFLLLGLLGFFAFLVTIGAWFAALFLGRIPDGMAGFLAKVLQYSARVYGYGFLLTDVYPPFSLDTDDHPITLAVPPPGRLNRLAVFFRIILLIPAGIVGQLALGGLGPAMVVIWLIVLVTGRLPASVWEAEASILQYQLRVYAYVGLLTSRYPRGLFGDDEPAEVPVAAVGDDEDDDDEDDDDPSPLAPPRVTRIPVSRPAKRLIALFLVLGVVFNAGTTASGAFSSNQADRAASKVQATYDSLEAVGTQFATDTQRCAINGGLECLHSANQRLAAAFDRFHTELGAVHFPDFAVASADDLRATSAEAAGILHQMATTSDADAYTELAKRFQTLGERFDRQYDQLRFDLSDY